MQLADVGRAPDLAADVILGEHLLRHHGLPHDGAGADEPHLVLLARLGVLELVEALQQVLLEARVRGRRGHGEVLVVDRDVVDHVLVLAPHLVDAVLDDVRALERERRVPRDHGRVRERDEVGVTVLMLQTLAVERRAAGRGAEEEATGARVGGLPDEVADALEAEHGVVDEEGQHGAALRGIRGAGGDPGAQGASLGDALLQHLAVGSLGVLHQDVVVHGRVVLAEGGVDLEFVEEGVEAEGTGLVGDERHDALAELRDLHQLAEERGEAHGGAHGLRAALVEHLVGGGLGQGHEGAGLGRRAQGVVASEGLALGLDVLPLRGALVRDTEELSALGVRDLLVRERHVQHVAEGHHLVVLQRLLLMDGVPALERGQTVALQGLGEDDGGAAALLGVPRGLREGGENLLLVVAARLQEGREQLVVVEVRHPVLKAVGDEDLRAHEGAVLLGRVALAVAVGAALEDLDEPAVEVGLDELVPLGSPDELDAVEPRAAEEALELLDDLGVAADGAVEALVVAVDDHDEVVQALVTRAGDGVDRLRLVHLTVTDEAPDAAAGGVRQAAEVQVAEEASLGHGREGADAHGHGGVLPEVRHEARMRVAGEALAAHLLAEVHDLLEGQAALQVRPRVGTGRRVALNVDLVAHTARVALAAPDVVLAHLPHVADGREGADVAAHARGAAVAVADHHGGVPAHEVGDAALDLEVAGVLRLHVGRDGVDHGRGHRGRDLHAHAHGLVDDLVHQEPRARLPVVLHDGVQRLNPLLGLVHVEARRGRAEVGQVGRVVAGVLIHEGQRRGKLRHVTTHGVHEFVVGDGALDFLRERVEQLLPLICTQRKPDGAHQLDELLAVHGLGLVHVGAVEPLVGELLRAFHRVLAEDHPQLLHQLFRGAVAHGGGAAGTLALTANLEPNHRLVAASASAASYAAAQGGHRAPQRRPEPRGSHLDRSRTAGVTPLTGNFA
mmetsp:Transcript_14414/g.43118  ORF Transcript_14414/g.43118 Transcript_14414/m.43118 type:complete len:959 (+) Transcript_14414:868-3744(+)